MQASLIPHCINRRTEKGVDDELEQGQLRQSDDSKTRRESNTPLPAMAQ